MGGGQRARTAHAKGAQCDFVCGLFAGRPADSHRQSDNTAKVWEAASGQELLTLKGHTDMIRSVVFSPDGWRIVTGSTDQTARVWEAARPEQIAVWQEEERAATQYLAAAQAEQEREINSRARDSIKQWLILAPINLATGESGAQGLDIEQIEGEGQLRPKTGESRFVGSSELKWREVALTDEVIDFNASWSKRQLRVRPTRSVISGR